MSVVNSVTRAQVTQGSTTVEPAHRSLFSLFRDALVQKAQRMVAHLTGRVSLLEDSECFNNIVPQPSAISSDVANLVRDFCDPAVTNLSIEDFNLSDPEVEAICAALEQNTVLTDLSFRNVYCDTTNFADKLTKALKKNSTLKRLVLDIADKDLSNINPPPMKPQALELLFKDLPCYNLESLYLGAGRITPGVAQAFATAIQNNPHFPLNKLFFTWYNIQFSAESFNTICEGLKASRCIEEVGLGIYAGIPEAQLPFLLEALRGNSSVLSHLNFWCPEPYPSNATKEQRLLTATEEALCFRSYSNLANPCFSSNLAGAINNITQGRVPCVRDPICGIRLNCSEPFVPSPSSSTSITQEPPFQAGMAAAGAIGVVALAIFSYQKKDRCKRGAAPEKNVQVIVIQRESTRTQDIPLKNLSPPPLNAGVEEGAAPQGEGEPF